ncbi:hypothetical protein MYAM1_001530 [Malassezia yamatoensis]|uniref:Trafficking protein particle complex subunit n=1 Tax=Malassezia yamatoensis TaxID=253288 RepID=A0AAJ5YT94_9BASI|nr:hypothetical protein MYAM1_001530 [Malassezia yamatoensis]
MASLWIINKAGGLIFQSEHFAYPHKENGEPELSSNDYLILAGTLHGIHAIASKIVPAPGKQSQGLEVLEAENLLIHIKMTETGSKFVLLTNTAHPDPRAVLNHAYQLYVDHVMKNPFYIPEMPIRIDTFDRQIAALIQ